ncbi:precorrin-2 dehydrogenase / sirohydrochlorin ferrochelatase [Entomortierella parvispora]|uniref:precorrin-2 dehydrogenase n=1 Tax=Entomortierella parvispora TaxID=205924 RepID=A0A9P3HFH9_9FUNG|nr:precorrin-2 dehydrogenase / sirohydrochlorin ferrochelatase [Entomortierella parvispora]
MVRSAIDPIRPGASLILAWQIKQRHAIIIGGGFVAAGRLVNVLEADAKVTVICPDSEQDPLSETVRQHLQDHPDTTRLVLRSFQDSDLTTAFGQHKDTYSFSTSTIAYNQERKEQIVTCPTITGESSGLGSAEPPVDMVLSAIDDIPLSTHIYHLCKSLRIPVNIADVPPQCDFYFCSTHRDQSLQVAVSTSGKGPKLANLIRRHIADHLPNRVGEAIEKVGKLRAQLRKMAPGPEVGPKRMQWMSRVCEEWKMEELAELDDESTKWVLQGFKDNIVYSLEEVRKKIKDETYKNIEFKRTDAAPTDEKNLLSIPSSDSTVAAGPRLILVGAGPGDPELLTRKAVRLLEEADLVISDRLIPSEVIDLAKGEVRIAPKKRASLQIELQSGTDQNSSTSTASDYIQDQLNEWCLEGLREGKTVVRLKQGDPFIFGRGAEEVLFFRDHGFEAEVVPGISSALSAPLAAGVPLTHRGSADQVIITTAQAKGGVLPDNFPTYDLKKTVVILMGVGKAQEISELMQSSSLGWPSDVPVVIVENAHCPNERTMDATLGTLAQVVKESKAVPPSVFVVGWAGLILRS